MDMFSIHPYPGELEHPADLRAPAEHVDRPRRLRQARRAARRCLRRHRAAGLVAADRLRRVRAPDGDPASRSSGATPAPSSRRRSRSTRQTQASRVRRRDRDRRLPSDGADAALLPRLRRAAARAPPDRRLLRRRHAEVEPGHDRPGGPRRPGAAPGLLVGGARDATRRSLLRIAGCGSQAEWAETPIYPGCGSNGGGASSWSRLRSMLALGAFAAHTVLPDSGSVAHFFDYRVYYAIIVAAAALTIARAVVSPLHREHGSHLPPPSPPTRRRSSSGCFSTRAATTLRTRRSRTRSTSASIPRATSASSSRPARACGR